MSITTRVPPTALVPPSCSQPSSVHTTTHNTLIFRYVLDASCVDDFDGSDVLNVDGRAIPQAQVALWREETLAVIGFRRFQTGE